jgi:hypothetical protein
LTFTLWWSDAERIGCAIDVIEPRRDEGDLENRRVVKTRRAQVLMTIRPTNPVSDIAGHNPENRPPTEEVNQFPIRQRFNVMLSWL